MKGLHQGDKAGKIQSPENPDPKLCFHLWLCAASGCPLERGGRKVTSKKGNTALHKKEGGVVGSQNESCV